MRVRMRFDWPPPPTWLMEQANLGTDYSDLPRIPAGTFGTVTAIVEELLMVAFDGYEEMPFFRSQVEEI